MDIEAIAAAATTDAASPHGQCRRHGPEGAATRAHLTPPAT